jgi:hypothetical protein
MQIINQLLDLSEGQIPDVPKVSGKSHEGPTWVNTETTEEERRNIEVVRRFWEVWKAIPFEPTTLQGFFEADAVVRIGWRGEHVTDNWEEALKGFIEEVKRQVEHDELTEFRFPILVAKGPVVFHTWTWISKSERLNYRFERPMAAMFLLHDSKIERWDNYATGKESSKDFVFGTGPDGL